MPIMKKTQSNGKSELDAIEPFPLLTSDSQKEANEKVRLKHHMELVEASM